MNLRRAILAGMLAATAIAPVVAPMPAYAQFGFGGIVYDPTNYAQNVLTAARSLSQINNQIQQIQQQATIVAAVHKPEPAHAPAAAVRGEARHDRLARELERCATLTMPDSGCEAAWAESRRRFFRQDAPAPAADASEPAAPATETPAP
jgi:conjugative transfer region protein TrbK